MLSALRRVVPIMILLVAFPLSTSADPCMPTCEGKYCGDDGCGGSCGPCESGACVDGACLADCTFVTNQGCCTGGVLVRCFLGVPQVSDCGSMPSCGWSDVWNGYACGTAGEEHPEIPKACGIDCDGFCGNRECGPGLCGDSCGTCDEGALCIDGQCCLPDCSDVVCGDDGCGGSCGECGEGERCQDGACCTTTCDVYECGDDGCGGSCGWCNAGMEGPCIGGVCVKGCYGLAQAHGCCNDNRAILCGSGSLSDWSCGEDPDWSCGWHPIGTSGGFYTCGGQGEDPNGEFPIDCAPYFDTYCDNHECGPSPNGENCGACAEGDKCVDGNCCMPDCEGKMCGSDGCGGGCGNCGGEGVCHEEICYSDCCEGLECGPSYCGGTCGGCPAGQVCAENSCCEPNCDGLACGPDPVCGADCWSCGEGQVNCDEGTCTPTWGATESVLPDCPCCTCRHCVCNTLPSCCSDEWTEECVDLCEQCGGFAYMGPDCVGRECGDDGCFGSCGDCSEGKVCDDGTCCTHECGDKTCGDDGCGGVCGECGEGQCIDGQCCVPDCGGKCNVPDGCGGTCPDCSLGAWCDDGVCSSLCADECDGQQCGIGKCGGPCSGNIWTGRCDNPLFACIEGLCLVDCGGIPEEQGCCVGDKRYGWCKQGTDPYHQLQVVYGFTDCSEFGDETCGWFPDPYCDDDTPWDCSGNYLCGYEGEDPDGVYKKECSMACRGPICVGRECGPDGCGGECGTCPDGFTCQDGTCCEQQCEGKECGPDGCGSWCGECPFGSRCSNETLCEPCDNPCGSRECGPDGCGGYCGHCPDPFECINGKCSLYGEGISPVGCCWGDIAVNTAYWAPMLFKCGPGQGYCGWEPKWEYYDCGTDGSPEPSGEYPKGCDEVCFAECYNKDCGDDGCGGDCGPCPSGFMCNSYWKCVLDPETARTWHLDYFDIVDGEDAAGDAGAERKDGQTGADMIATEATHGEVGDLNGSTAEGQTSRGSKSPSCSIMDNRRAPTSESAGCVLLFAVAAGILATRRSGERLVHPEDRRT